MANVLEWVQCSGCGRRHRWKAELVGTDIVCACGTKVHVPNPEEQAEASKAGSGFDPEDTLVDPSLTNEAAAISDAPEYVEDGMALEEDAKRKARAREHQKKLRASAKVDKFGDRQVVTYVGRKPLLGMSRQGEMIFWLCAILVAFTLVVHAIIVQLVWYIGASVIMVPLALWKFIPSYKRWRGNRSFSRAWHESFAPAHEAGDEETGGT